MVHKMAHVSWIGSILVVATVACSCGLWPGLGETSTAMPARQPTGASEGVSSAETPSTLALETENAMAYETAMAMATEVSASMTAPEDIPVYKPNENFSGSTVLVAYDTSDGYASVLDFYKTELPANGWTKLDADDTLERAGSYAHLFYTKDNRTIDLTITATEEKKVMVLIFIETGGS